jgi:UDPglucose 6-dehydrogenase
VGCDPRSGPAALGEVPGLEIVDDPFDAATGAHCVVLATEWEQFRSLDLARLRDAMAYPVVVDGRNAFDPDMMRQAGIAYYPTGRPPIADGGSDVVVLPSADGGTLAHVSDRVAR